MTTNIRLQLIAAILFFCALIAISFTSVVLFTICMMTSIYLSGVVVGRTTI